ncbi:MAG TPA: Hsp20/alpha crystallin family protein [Burkholderiaceae bacterium]
MNTATKDVTTTSSTTPATRQATQADERTMMPRVDVFEDDAGITLLADLPGVPKDQLELKIDGETLLIEGSIATPTPQNLQSVYAEIRVPKYRRAFVLSRELDASRIEANLRDGVLNLRIPKQEHAKPRRIDVRAA